MFRIFHVQYPGRLFFYFFTAAVFGCLLLIGRFLRILPVIVSASGPAAGSQQQYQNQQSCRQTGYDTKSLHFYLLSCRTSCYLIKCPASIYAF